MDPGDQLLVTDTDHAAHAAFLATSAKLVEESAPGVLRQIETRNLPQGKWHPNGFAVFHLAQIEGLGRLRLHFWPRGLRNSLPGHPPVHTHSWRLHLKVLEGTYRDRRFDVTLGEQTTDVDRNRAGRVYLVGYGKARPGVDLLEDTGDWAQIRPTGDMITDTAGSTHEMKPGLFHATPIPSTAFCSTLVVMSDRVPGFPDVLVGNPAFGTTEHARPFITANEVDLMCQQFTEARAARIAGPESTGLVGLPI